MSSISSSKPDSPAVISSDYNPNVYFIKATEKLEVQERPKHKTHSQRDSGISIMGSRGSLSNGNLSRSSRDSINVEATSHLKTSDMLIVEPYRHNRSSSGDSLIVESYRNSGQSLNIEAMSNRSRSTPDLTLCQGPGVDMNSKARRSLSTNSEEAQVLACFDQIYQEFDSSDGSTNELLNGSCYNTEVGGYLGTKEITPNSTCSGCHGDGMDSRGQLAGLNNEGFISDIEGRPVNPGDIDVVIVEPAAGNEPVTRVPVDDNKPVTSNLLMGSEPVTSRHLVGSEPVTSDPKQTCYVIFDDEDIINGNLIQTHPFSNPAYVPD